MTTHERREPPPRAVASLSPGMTAHEQPASVVRRPRARVDVETADVGEPHQAQGLPCQLRLPGSLAYC